MKDPAVHADKLERIFADHVRSLNELVDDIRRRPGRESTPYVDPDSGGTHARVLFLLQDPSAKAGASGFISWDNDDATAAMCSASFARHAISRTDVVPWNAIPWPSGRTMTDKRAGRTALLRVLDVLERLQVVMALGSVAREQWEAVRAANQRARRLHAVYGPHPSTRGLTNGGRQSKADGLVALDAAFAEVASLLRDGAQKSSK